MNKTAIAKRVAELQADIARFTALLEQAESRLAKYPNDPYSQQDVSDFKSVIARASRFIEAVSK